jgi:hypothetical protein
MSNVDLRSPDRWHEWPVEAKEVFTVLLKQSPRAFAFHDPWDRKIVMEAEFFEFRPISRRTFVEGVKFLRDLGVIRFWRKRPEKLRCVELMVPVPEWMLAQANPETPDDDVLLNRIRVLATELIRNRHAAMGVMP